MTKEQAKMQKHIVNGVSHFDVSGPDAVALGRYYSKLFDWTVKSKGPGYALIETPGGSPNGAIVEAENASLTMGVVVSDIDQCVAKAVGEGGQIGMPVIDNGWVKKAVIIDPAGNRLTLIQA
jgi:predicted enzyme related to lactoylglutathione lyase